MKVTESYPLRFPIGWKRTSSLKNSRFGRDKPPSIYESITVDNTQSPIDTHHPVDDAMGNAEALLEFRKLGLKNL